MLAITLSLSVFEPRNRDRGEELHEGDFLAMPAKPHCIQIVSWGSTRRWAAVYATLFSVDGQRGHRRLLRRHSENSRRMLVMGAVHVSV